MLIATCCQGANRLSLNSFDTGEQIGTVPTGGHPVHLTVAEDNVFVATMDERTVTVVDTDGAVSTIPTGVLGPSHFVTAAGTLFVACTGGDVVAAIDPTALERIGRTSVGREPHELAVADGRVFAGSRRDGTVSVIDPNEITTERSIPVGPDAYVEDVEAAPDGECVYAIDEANGRVASLTRTDLLATADLDAELTGIDVTDDRVFVLEETRGVVHEFDRDLERITEHDVGREPIAATTVAGAHWIGHRDDQTIQTLSGTVLELPYPVRALTSVGTSRILVSHYYDDSITMIDAERRTVDWTAETEANPLGVAVI